MKLKHQVFEERIEIRKLHLSVLAVHNPIELKGIIHQDYGLFLITHDPTHL